MMMFHCRFCGKPTNKTKLYMGLGIGISVEFKLKKINGRWSWNRNQGCDELTMKLGLGLQAKHRMEQSAVVGSIPLD
jgi:hypothetical protein